MSQARVVVSPSKWKQRFLSERTSDRQPRQKQIEENKQYNYNKAKQASNGCLLVVVTIGKSVLCLRKFFY